MYHELRMGRDNEQKIKTEEPEQCKKQLANIFVEQTCGMAIILRHDINYRLSRIKWSVNSKPFLDKHVTTPPTRSAWNSRFFHAPKQSIANPRYVYSVSGY